MTDSVERLYEGVIAARHGDPARSRTARLLRSGRAKMAKKLAEEAVEVVIDAMNGSRDAVVKESADLHLQSRRALGRVRRAAEGSLEGDGAARASVRHRREAAKDAAEADPRRKVVALESRRVRKRR